MVFKKFLWGVFATIGFVIIFIFLSALLGEAQESPLSSTSEGNASLEMAKKSLFTIFSGWQLVGVVSFAFLVFALVRIISSR